MPTAHTFLSVDCGAATLKAAEFEATASGGLRLTAYGFKPIGSEAMTEPARAELVRQGLEALLDEAGLTAKDTHACLPGFQVISKLVKLPRVDHAKVAQIIQYEAQQNLPFPLDQMVWDFQIVGASPGDTVEVWIVGARLDDAGQIAQGARAAGLNLQLLDAPAAALANAFRYNYNGLEGCSLLLDIGARNSTLLFLDGDRIMARAISLGANSITQDFSKETKLGHDDAESLKISEGFVSLGGIYPEPEEEQRAVLSKIARQVMARLHVQVGKTIQVYRTQQGGAAPQRLFLSGGGSSLPYTAEFFGEKLGLPVEYFNPLQHIELSPALDAAEAGKVAHTMGELVGLALRNVVHCPVEFNLMPKPLLKQQELRARTPFLAAAAAYLLLVMFVLAWFCTAITDLRRDTADHLEELLGGDAKIQQQLQTRLQTLRANQPALDELRDLLESRFFWARVLEELRREMQAAEKEIASEVSGTPNLWIERFQPARPGADTSAPGRIKTVSVHFGARDLRSPAQPGANAQVVSSLIRRLGQNPAFGKGTKPGTGTNPTNSVFNFDVLLELEPTIKSQP